MKSSFNLSDKLKQISQSASEMSKKLKKQIQDNAVIACEAMEQAAKDHTPNKDDGKQRGFNVISNSLQDSWRAEFIKSNNSKELGEITLTNDKPYAPYVQNGHRVTKHFVPWLYKDDLGTISYEDFHAQSMFGLVVGTKTNYVEGVDMIGPAEKAFDEKFNELNEKTLSDLKKKIFK